MKILLKGKRSCTLNNSRIKWIPQLLQEEQIIEMFSGFEREWRGYKNDIYFDQRFALEEYRNDPGTRKIRDQVNVAFSLCADRIDTGSHST